MHLRLVLIVNKFMSILMSRHMCVNCKAMSMKYLILSLFLVSTIAVAKTPQEILREEGFVLVSKESGKEVYYRPKEVKRNDGIVYYSTTIFYTAGSNKYGLKSNYDAIACKEKKVVRLGIHSVPYIGKSSYTDLTKKGIKETDIKPYQSNTDRVMASKLCR